MSVETLVSTEWVAAQLGDPSVRVLQAVFPEHCYAAAGVPGSGEFVEEECRSEDSPWHTMLPTAERFAEYVGGELGVGRRSHVVVYDASELSRGGLETAARLWFTFRVFGHTRVSLMEGGLAKWLQEGRPTGPAVRREPCAYEGAALDGARVADFGGVVKAVREASAWLVDSRSEKRFSGAAGEPAGGVGGAIRGSVCLPYPRLVEPSTGLVRPREELRELFRQRGVEVGGGRGLIATCGTGTTALGLNVAWELLTGDIGRLYDGSWFEYSRRLGLNPPPAGLEREAEESPFDETFSRLRSNSIPQVAQ